MDNQELASQVINLNRDLESLNEKRIKALGKQEAARNQMEALKEKIAALGSSPETLDKDIEEAKSQLESTLSLKKTEMETLEWNLKKIEDLEK